MRSFLPLLLFVSVLGCTDDDPVAFKSKEPFDAVIMDGMAASAYGLRLAGEERTTICSSCFVVGRSPAGDQVLLTQPDQGFFIAEPGRINEVLDLAGAAVDEGPAELPTLLEAAWSPDSKHLALLWGTSQAFVAAADGTGIVPVATGAFNPASSDDPNIVLGHLRCESGIALEPGRWRCEVRDRGQVGEERGLADRPDVADDR